MKLIKNANHQLTEKQQQRIQNKISELEAETDAEIVVAVATESGRYDRAESIGGLLAAVTALVLGHFFLTSGDWGGRDALPLAWQVVLVVAGFFAGLTVISYWASLRHVLTSPAEVDAEISRAVDAIFIRHPIGARGHGPGLLIYLTLCERRVEVRCDRTVRQKLRQQDLEEICEAVLKRESQGQVAEGLLDGLDVAKAKLSQVLPATPGNQRSVSNELMLFHPRP